MPAKRTTGRKARAHRLAGAATVLVALLSILVPTAGGDSAPCAATRVLLYTSSDWARLSQGLAANPSACAQYYVSVNPLTANKTVMRPKAAARIDALGPNFHSLAEVNYTAWSKWVASTGSSWQAAGQAARASMDAAGFSAASGDTWAINELPSSVRTNTGTARQDAEQLIQGLCTGSGSGPAEPGVVFMIGVGQTGTKLQPYKASLESWFEDSSFWDAINGCVSDFLFEAYGDVRDYAIAGEDPATRIGYLNAYLEAPLQLVMAANAPADSAAARSFLESTYAPLANASWAWATHYGWTQVGSDVMADYISAQTYAMRAFDGGGRIGFAWNPLNTQSLSDSDFNTEVGGILARLAGSIHETDTGDPAQACEATGCSAALTATNPASGWNAFSSWTPTTAAIISAPQTLTSNAPSGPITVELETGTVPATLPNASTVTVTADDSAVTFSLSPGGPWTSTLALTLPAGTRSAGFYALGQAIGSPTISTDLDGALSVQTELPSPVSLPLAPPPVPRPVILPVAHVTTAALVPEHNHMHLELAVSNDAGQPLGARVAFALLLGSTPLATASGLTNDKGELTITAAARLQRGCYRVTVTSLTYPGYRWDGLSPPGTTCITTLPARAGGLSLTLRHRHLHLIVRASDDADSPLLAYVRLALTRGPLALPVVTGRTSSSNGVLSITLNRRLVQGCYHARVVSLTAPGYTWDHLASPATYCVPKSAIPVKPHHHAGKKKRRHRGTR